MPHAIIEYSESITQNTAQNTAQKLTPAQLLSVVYESTLASELFNKTDIKVRAIPYASHQSGADHTDFIHVTLKILAGRTVEQRNHLSKRVLKELSTLPLTSVSLSVEVCNIETASYNKQIKS